MATSVVHCIYENKIIETHHLCDGSLQLDFFFTKAMKFIVIEGPTYVSILMRKGEECQNPSHIKLNLGGYKMYIILVNFLLAHMVLEVK